MYMHGCNSWCFQSFYNLLPCLVGPLICHTTNFSPSPRDTSEVFHIEAGKGSIFTSKTFGPCQGKLFPPREGVGWTCRLLNSHHFFGASDFFLIKKKDAYYLCLNYQQERRVVHICQVHDLSTNPKNMI